MKNPMFQQTRNFDIDFNKITTPQSMQRQHYHDTYEIYLVLDGERNLFFDDEKYLLKKGNLFVIEPFVLHSTTCADSVCFSRYLINLSPNELAPILNEKERNTLFQNLTTSILSLNDEKLQYIYFCFKEIHKYKNEKGKLSDKLMRMNIAHLIDFICAEAKNNFAINPKGHTKKSEAPIMKALAYINLNYTQNISLDFISGYAHMSKSNFCLVFKKIIGVSFVDYINAIRISQVHKLLLTTNLPLTAIAEQTGFSSVDYMTRAFKHTHGISPSAMRKMKRT